MAKPRSEFADFVAEQLAFMPGLNLRRMFGGYGVYADGLMFAIIVEDCLYFKADATSRQMFVDQGLAPFRYHARGKAIAIAYYEAPGEVFDEPEAMRFWAETAWQAALRGQATSKPRKK